MTGKFYKTDAASEEKNRDVYAIPAPQPVSVKVKLLDWRPEPPYHVARVFGNVYAVEAWAGGATLSGVGGRRDFKTLSEAKDAAQADYESRIRSSLSSPVEGGTEKELADHAAFDRETEILKERLRAATVGRDAARKALLAGSMNLIPDKVFDAIHEASASPSPSAEIEALQKIIRDQKASLLDYSARNIRLNDQHDELQAEIEALRVGNAALRKIISDCAASLSNGAFIDTACSVEFMQGLPKEISLVCATLQQREEGNG